MILEDKDFFVISDEAHVEIMPDGTKMISSPRFEGMIFQAKKVELHHVLAKIIEIDAPADEKDIVISLNTKNYDIDTVSKEYAELYMNSRRPEGMGTIREFMEETSGMDDEELNEFFENLEDNDDIDDPFDDGDVL